MAGVAVRAPCRGGTPALEDVDADLGVVGPTAYPTPWGAPAVGLEVAKTLAFVASLGVRKGAEGKLPPGPEVQLIWEWA